jgi:hypothetical protein
LLTANAEGLLMSHDDGVTWPEVLPAAFGQDPAEPASCYVSETVPGTLVMVFLDIRSPRKKFAWNSEKGEPEDGCCLEMHSIRSQDGGRNWSEPFVMARLRGGQLSYPHVVERRAGEVWVTAGFASRRWFNEDPTTVGVRIFEKDLPRSGFRTRA